MKFIVREVSTDVVTDGVYQAQITRTEVVSGTGKFGEWSGLKFFFSIIEGEEIGKVISGLAFSQGMTEGGDLVIQPGKQLSNWLSILGIDLEIDTEVDDVDLFESLVGRTCYVITTQSKSVKKGVENTYSNVTEIRPCKKKVLGKATAIVVKETVNTGSPVTTVAKKLGTSIAKPVAQTQADLVDNIEL